MEEIKTSAAASPARLVAIGFLGLIITGALLLCLPLSARSGAATPFLDALFTATSAVSLTGLVVVDTATHWTLFGQIVILFLIQLGGLGIMTLTSLGGMMLTGRVGLRSRMNAAQEGRGLTPGTVVTTVKATLLLTVVAELCVAVIIAVRMHIAYGASPVRSVWEGVFHAISAFNNAGFGLRSDSLVPYVGDAWIILPLAGALIIGGLGFPVLGELAARLRDALRDMIRLRKFRGVFSRRTPRLSITARITIIGTLFLIGSGVLLVGLLEWRGALAALPDTHTKLLAAFFQGVSPRTAGFNSVDYGDFHPVTLMGVDVLMFIGGGSAGTAGGVKITTFAVLVAGVLAEFQRQDDPVIAGRRLESTVIRQAVTVFFAGILVIVVAIGLLRFFDPEFSGDQITFEVVSAFGTVGLSTGITADLSSASNMVLMLLMFLGRVGPITLVMALAVNREPRKIAYPKERPFIG